MWSSRQSRRRQRYDHRPLRAAAAAADEYRARPCRRLEPAGKSDRVLRQGAGITWEAVVRYKVETLRLIANMSLGVGALAVIGGTVVIVTTLTMSVGGLVAIQLFRSLSDVGVQALSGFASAYINTR